MSGGHFQYEQYKISLIAEEIETLIENNESTELDQWGNKKGAFYTPETIQEFKNALIIMKKAYIYAQRIDWLVSGDDGEDSFHRRLAEDISQILD